MCHLDEELYFVLDARVGGLGKQQVTCIFRAILAGITCDMLMSYPCYTYETDSDVGFTFLYQPQVWRYILSAVEMNVLRVSLEMLMQRTLHKS